MSLFATSAGRSAKFPNIGDSITGTVRQAPFEKQQTKYGTNELDFWPNGDPKMAIVIPLSTSLREDAEDDGERAIYITSSRQKRAIADAIRAAGLTDLSVGATLTLKYVGNDPASKNPANPAKMWAAQISAPTAFAQQTAPPAAVQQAPAAAPAPAVQQGLTQEQAGKVAQLRAAGIDDATIATAVGVDINLIAQTPF